MTNSIEAFHTVERKHTDMIAARILLNYDVKSNFNPNLIEPFLKPDELAAREEIFKALTAYATSLSVIMGNTQLDQFDLATKQFGLSLTGINRTMVKDKYLTKSPVSDDDVGIFTTAVNTLGRWFIDWRRDRDVKEQVKVMQKPVKDITRLISEDIGFPKQEVEAGHLKDADSGKGQSKANNGRPSEGRGLRNELWNTYTNTLQSQDLFIRHNWDRLSPAERRSEIQKLVGLVTERTQADQTLLATKVSLGSLAAAHEQLVDEFENPSINFEARITELINEGKRINAYFDALNQAK